MREERIEEILHFKMTSSGKSVRNATRFESVAERAEALPLLGTATAATAELMAACFSIRLLKSWQCKALLIASHTSLSTS
jgi:hypothetical protein